MRRGVRLEESPAAAKPRKQASKARHLSCAVWRSALAYSRPATQAEKPKASAPSEEDLDAAYAALADARGVVTSASLLAKSAELNFGWDESDTRSMLHLFGAGRSLSRAEFAHVAAAVKARKPKRG